MENHYSDCIGASRTNISSRRYTIFEALGFYSSADFIELGVVFGVSEEEVREHTAKFMATRCAVERIIAESRLSAEAKTRYLAKYAARLCVAAICRRYTIDLPPN